MPSFNDILNSTYSWGLHLCCQPLCYELLVTMVEINDNWLQSGCLKQLATIQNPSAWLANENHHSHFPCYARFINLQSGAVFVGGSLWKEVQVRGKKYTWYIYLTSRLPKVQNLDFYLIGCKTKENDYTDPDWLLDETTVMVEPWMWKANFPYSLPVFTVSLNIMGKSWCPGIHIRSHPFVLDDSKVVRMTKITAKVSFGRVKFYSPTISYEA